MSEEILNEALDSAFVSPLRKFKGEELAPYTEGSRLLMVQVRDDNDSTPFFIWSFVYLHLQIQKDRKEAMRLAWNKELFRERVFEWVGNLNEADREIATDLATTMIEEATKARVEIIPLANQLPDQPGNK